MMDSWDPVTVLLFEGLGYLILLTIVCAVLYTIIKHAVRQGIKLAADDVRALREAARGE